MMLDYCCEQSFNWLDIVFNSHFPPDFAEKTGSGGLHFIHAPVTLAPKKPLEGKRELCFGLSIAGKVSRFPVNRTDSRDFRRRSARGISFAKWFRDNSIER